MIIAGVYFADENDTLGSELSYEAVQRERGIQVERLKSRVTLRCAMDSQGNAPQRDDN